MNWITYDLSPAPCLPCCVLPSQACYLTMPTSLVDGTTTNYADSTAAAAALASQAAPGCYAEANELVGSETRTTLSSSFSGGVLSAATAKNTPFGSVPGSGSFSSIIVRVYLTVADGLSVVYSLTASGSIPDDLFGGFSVILYQDNQSTIVDSVISDTPISGTFSPTIPSDGYYYIKANAAWNSLIGTDDATSSASMSSITGGSSMVPCTARAAYDDGSGGTAYVLCV